MASPFVVEYWAYCKDHIKAETAAHHRLASKRINKNREFFEVTVNEAASAITDTGLVESYYSRDEDKSRQQAERIRQRKIQQHQEQEREKERRQQRETQRQRKQQEDLRQQMHERFDRLKSNVHIIRNNLKELMQAKEDCLDKAENKIIRVDSGRMTWIGAIFWLIVMWSLFGLPIYLLTNQLIVFLLALIGLDSDAALFVYFYCSVQYVVFLMRENERETENKIAEIAKETDNQIGNYNREMGICNKRILELDRSVSCLINSREYKALMK